jgi:hypothetical protein
MMPMTGRENSSRSIGIRGWANLPCHFRCTRDLYDSSDERGGKRPRREERKAGQEAWRAEMSDMYTYMAGQQFARLIAPVGYGE